MNASKRKSECQRGNNRLKLLYIPTSLAELPDPILWLLHAINWQVVCRRVPYGEYVPLASKILQTVLGRDYCRTVASASARYVETDNYFVLGEKCRGFRIREPFRSEPGCFKQLRDKAIQRRLATQRQQERKQAKRRINGTSYKQCIADLRTVTIADLDWENFEVRGRQGWSGAKIGEYAEFAVRKIRQRDWFYSVCDYGRLHTNITSLNNELVPYLRLDGESVVSVDIANSQPLFLAAYLRGLIDQRNTTNTPNTITLCKHTLPDYENLNKTRLSRQVSAISEIAASGTLYDDIADYASTSRTAAKQQFFAFAYGPNHYRNACRDWFENKIPLVADLIDAIKTEHGYACLAHEMQRAESAFMFGQVVPAIHRKLSTRLLTKHDSVLVPVEFADSIVSIFGDEFLRLGITGRVKIEVP